VLARHDRQSDEKLPEFVGRLFVWSLSHIEKVYPSGGVARIADTQGLGGSSGAA
jgi:hypothetical protein